MNLTPASLLRSETLAPGQALHFLGIGGSGMTPLALLATSQGFQVSGSDGRASANTARLHALGIPLNFDHSNHHLLAHRPLVVVSSAIKGDNPELVAAQNLGLDLWHRSDLLAYFVAQSPAAVTVAGTHGKTTTTAMLAYLLEAMQLAPQAVIGGALQLKPPSSVLTGRGPHLIAEADESDGTFLKYRPHVAVITNCDADHLDYYHDAEGVVAAFARHRSHIRPGGIAVIGHSGHLIGRLLAEPWQGRQVSFGWSSACDFYASDFKSIGSYSHFTLHARGKQWPVKLRALGEHNVANACGALAAIAALELDLEAAIPLLARYPGVARRLSFVYQSAEGLTIIDDYAHNPGKILAAIAAVRAAYPQERLVVVFQAHRFSRIQTMGPEFMRAFPAADEVYCLPVYAAGEAFDPSITPASLAAGIAQGSRVTTHAAADFPSLVQVLAKTKPANTVILTLGAGDVTALATLLAETLIHDDTN